MRNEQITPDMLRLLLMGRRRAGAENPFAANSTLMTGMSLDSTITPWNTGPGPINLPRAGSMVGTMSGDAGADITEARRAAGPSPLDEYVPPSYKTEHPEWGDVQAARNAEYQARVGQELGAITGLEGGYDPNSGGREQIEIQNRGLTEEQIRRRAEWLEQMKRVRGGR